VDLDRWLAVVDDLLSRPYPPEQEYHSVNLRVSNDFWDDVDGTAVEAALAWFEADRVALADALSARWGAPQRVDLGPHLDRSLRGELLTPMTDHLANFVSAVDAWHRGDRTVCVGVGQHDKELPIQLVLTVGELDPPVLTVEPYDPGWRRRGAELVAELRTALGPLAVRVEHIGSTSIPGMAAKPVFDLQVSVRDLAGAAATFDAPLAAFGLARRPYEQDHVPAGCADPPELWRKRLWSKPQPGGERINLHCRLVGSPNERLALLFRDWFRAHPAAVPAYGEFKLRLAAAVRDIETYTDIKDPVVDLVIGTAETWAAATGWSP